MPDNREKYVSDRLINRVSVTSSLKSLFTDVVADGRVAKNDSFEIPTRSAIQVEQVSTGSGAATMTVQTNTATPNLLTVDQHYGAVIEIGKMNAKYDLAGAWSDQLGDQVMIEIDNYVDSDVFTRALLYGGAWLAGATTPTTWVNPSGAAVTQDMTEQALAVMSTQRGVSLEGCEWVFHPYGLGSIRRLSAFTPIHTPVAAGGSLGMRTVGELHGLPVKMTNAVPNRLSIATTAVVVSTNVATATVAAGHGVVAGMLLTSTGHTVNSSANVTVTSTTETTIVYPLTTGDATLADGIGTLTVNLTINGLVHRPWAFIAQAKVPTIAIHARTGGKIVDELQSHTFWGSRGLPGAFIALGSPRLAFT